MEPRTEAQRKSERSNMQETANQTDNATKGRERGENDKSAQTRTDPGKPLASDTFFSQLPTVPLSGPDTNPGPIQASCCIRHSCPLRCTWHLALDCLAWLTSLGPPIQTAHLDPPSSGSASDPKTLFPSRRSISFGILTTLRIFTFRRCHARVRNSGTPDMIEYRTL
ncbi:hypothetical protein BS17DRAFT_360541 [Gyrodon lividus]|nr:hypothetical protein BS17DRAFT_360541 [Gyrodon lividus]